MDNNKSTPGHKDWELTHKEVAYQGFFRIERLWLRHKTFAGGWTDTFSRELFERGEVVCVLLYDPQRDVLVFTEQFRVGAIGADNTPWLTELVAGMVEAGESVEDVAARETMEEAGCRFERLLPICSYWSSPGGTSERVHLFCGLLDSRGVEGIHGLPEEHEDIRLRPMSFEDAWQAFEAGEIDNAATIIALQWMKIHHSELSQY